MDAQVTFSFLFSLGSQHMAWRHPYLGQGFSSQLSQPETSSQTCPMICDLGDLKLCEVEKVNHREYLDI